MWVTTILMLSLLWSSETLLSKLRQALSALHMLQAPVHLHHMPADLSVPHMGGEPVRALQVAVDHVSIKQCPQQAPQHACLLQSTRT